MCVCVCVCVCVCTCCAHACTVVYIPSCVLKRMYCSSNPQTGIVPVVFAAMKGHKEILQALIDQHGCSPKDKTPVSGGNTHSVWYIYVVLACIEVGMGTALGMEMGKGPTYRIAGNIGGVLNFVWRFSKNPQNLIPCQHFQPFT